MADDEKKQPEALPHSLTISVIQNKLTLILQHKLTKNMYRGAFTSQGLIKCGFSAKQAANLDGICKFISTAKAGHNNLKLIVSIEQNDNNHDANDNDNDEEGVHGVVVSDTATKAAKVENEEVGLVKIVKEDDFFGNIEFLLPLKKMPRMQSDLNQDHIKDLKAENAELTQKLNILQQDYTKNSIDLKQKNVALEQELNALRDDQRKRDVKSTQQLNANKAERDKLKEQYDTLQTEVNKMKEMIVESKKEYNNNIKKTDINIHEEINEMSKHEMPKGSIIMWSGAINNIPKGWHICNGNDNTPDLRNRFIIGAGDQYNVKKIGGNTSHQHNINVNGHQLTINQIPSHQHDFYKNVWVYEYGKNNCYICQDGSKYKWLNKCESGDANRRTKPNGGNQAHDHTASSSTKQHLPPYYALCFIIKII